MRRPTLCYSSTVLAPTLPAREARIRTSSWPSLDATRFLPPISAPTGRGVSHTMTDKACSPFGAQSHILLAADRGTPSFMVCPSLRRFDHVLGAYASTPIDDILYTVSELTSNLFAHHLPPLPAPSTLLSMTPTLQLQPGEALGNRTIAELLLAPPLKEDACDGSKNGCSYGGTHSAPFLYATNRNDPSAAGDTVAIFSLENPAKPVLIEEVHTGLRHLRGATIGGEDGRWMVLGGMLGGGVKVYERVDGGRSLKEIAALPGIEKPATFLWLTPRGN